MPTGHFVNEIKWRCRPDILSMRSECLEGMEVDHIKLSFWLQAYRNEVYLLQRSSMRKGRKYTFLESMLRSPSILGTGSFYTCQGWRPF